MCQDVVWGSDFGIINGVFEILLFTVPKTDEIVILKKLAQLVMGKSPEIVTEPVMCKAIR